ncbi:UDP-N-acetylmuramate dehydrogenase [Simiduia sp. 21SJ11W-1]|uniref:UDP-N-acetylmuramate dehydrogenase n=1 Tax=Simiduia sp. 21SJ11W-1 TaxID=2909669 RepID=UPI00209D6B2F|nr:UDP-N-acetylmuramate dehydrogenase [Simiduia sp. 21SJ11W-1]UTA49442.1 UDP-N-acetylmuramate dehydrogenase [Simiduia sp. 21SJ11W-1]
MNIQTKVNLAPYCTMATPAVAERLVVVESTRALREALALAQANRWPVYVLGGGSNVVFKGDLAGLVIHMAIDGITLQDAQDTVLVTAGAGVRWQALVDFCVAQNLWGVENLNLIPGTVGAAPIQNIGAYGVELESIFHRLELVRVDDLSAHTFTPEMCEFSYRQSRFKREPGAYVITSVTLRLARQGEPQLSYPGLQNQLAHVAGPLTPKAVADTVAAIRRAKLPDPKDIPNSGSFFHNPIVSASKAAELQARWPNLVSFAQPNGQVKLAAGWLIEQAGFKGQLYDGVGMHSQQALVMTNPGRCNGSQVLALAETVAQKVNDLFGVQLHVEPQILP